MATLYLNLGFKGVYLKIIQKTYTKIVIEYVLNNCLKIELLKLKCQVF